MNDARDELLPLIDAVLNDSPDLPAELPRWFFGLHEGQFGLIYWERNDGVFSAVASFDVALGRYASREASR